MNKIGKGAPKIAEASRSSSCCLEEVSLRCVDLSVKNAMDFFEALGPSCDCKLNHLNIENNDLDVHHFSNKLKQYPELNVTF